MITARRSLYKNILKTKKKGIFAVPNAKTTLENIEKQITDIVNKYETGKIVPNNNFIAKMERVLGAKLPRAIKPKK